MSKRKSTKHCCFVLFCGAPRALLSERCAAGGHHRPSGHRPAAHPGGEYHDGKGHHPHGWQVQPVDHRHPPEWLCEPAVRPGRSGHCHRLWYCGMRSRQVGCTAGYDHSPFPVSSFPQSRLALQGNKKKTLCDLSRSVFSFWCLKNSVFCYFFQSENRNNFLPLYFLVL